MTKTTTATYATDSQMDTIRAQRYDDTARAMMRDGVSLTHEQADTLDDAQRDWIRTRLGLTVETDDRGIHYRLA